MISKGLWQSHGKKSSSWLSSYPVIQWSVFFLNGSHGLLYWSSLLQYMVPVNFIFERSVFEARSFPAVLIRMIKLFCRKKLAPRISVVRPQSLISNYAKSAAGTASLQADSPLGYSSGSNLFLQHSSTAHTASTLQSKERGSHRVQCCP